MSDSTEVPRQARALLQEADRLMRKSRVSEERFPVLDARVDGAWMPAPDPAAAPPPPPLPSPPMIEPSASSAARVGNRLAAIDPDEFLPVLDDRVDRPTEIRRPSTQFGSTVNHREYGYGVEAIDFLPRAAASSPPPPAPRPVAPPAAPTPSAASVNASPSASTAIEPQWEAIRHGVYRQVMSNLDNYVEKGLRRRIRNDLASAADELAKDLTARLAHEVAQIVRRYVAAAVDAEVLRARGGEPPAQ